MEFAPLKEYMKKLCALGVPGCELTVCRHGQVLFHECEGYSDRAGRRPACPEDRYLLYSCSKPVTAAAGLQCVEKGLFTLDDPVSRYLPAFSDVRAEGVPVGDRLKIRHLFTMTAGLNYDLNRPALKKLPPDADTVQFASALAEDGLDFEPGARFQYSLCHDVLGAVISVASKMPFGQFVKENIFDKLGMADSEYWHPGTEYGGMAQLWSYDGKKVNAVPTVNTMIPFTNFDSGGAGLLSTVSDYMKFADSMTRDEKILSRKSIDFMRTEQIREFRVDGGFSCTCGPDYGYGMGVRTRVENAHGAATGKGEFGWDGAAGADVLMDPENGVAMCFGMNVLGWPSLVGVPHLDIRDALYPVPEV